MNARVWRTLLQVRLEWLAVIFFAGLAHIGVTQYFNWRTKLLFWAWTYLIGVTGYNAGFEKAWIERK